MKNSLTPAGIEPATYRFVAQHLNHRAIVVPQRTYYRIENIRDCIVRWSAFDGHLFVSFFLVRHTVGCAIKKTFCRVHVEFSPLKWQ